MKKLLAFALSLLMIFSFVACVAEPQETERALNGEPARGVFIGGKRFDYDKREWIAFEGENPIGSAVVDDAVYYNKAFGIRVEKEGSTFYTDIFFAERENPDAKEKIDPADAEFYDLYCSAGDAGTFVIRYENMPKYRGKILSEKEYAESYLDEYAENMVKSHTALGEDITVLEKEISTVKVDGETLWCLKYHISLDNYDSLKCYKSVILRKTGEWMTAIEVLHAYPAVLEDTAKCLFFE